MRNYLVELFPAKGYPSLRLMQGETVEEVKLMAKCIMNAPGYIDVYPIKRDRDNLLYLGEVE